MTYEQSAAQHGSCGPLLLLLLWRGVAQQDPLGLAGKGTGSPAGPQLMQTGIAEGQLLNGLLAGMTLLFHCNLMH